MDYDSLYALVDQIVAKILEDKALEEKRCPYCHERRLGYTYYARDNEEDIEWQERWRCLACLGVSATELRPLRQELS